MLRALGKAHKTLGKWIAECNTRQCALGTYGLGKAVVDGGGVAWEEREETAPTAKERGRCQ